MDDVDRWLINTLQDGVPVVDRPFADLARRLGSTEQAVVERIARLLEAGVLTRFGPMFNADRLGGTNILAAMSVPADAFETVADHVNTYPEVAHNYARDHDLNMWFVLACEQADRAAEIMAEIEAESGLKVYAMPKIEEFFVGARFEA
jgi:DNA-binding Lrp family transcriptional regulator